MTGVSRPRTTASGALLAVTLFVAVPQATVSAQPGDDPTDPMERYERLGAKAAQTEEDFSEAERDLAARRTTRERATAAHLTAQQALSRAQQAQRRFQGEIDEFASASLRNGRVVRWSAVFTSGSASDFLDRMSALDLVAAGQADTLDRLSTVTTDADRALAAASTARRDAHRATTAAERAVATLRERRADLDDQIAEVRAALGALSDDDRTALGAVRDDGVYLGPPGAANDAMQAALAKRGTPYQWGATGPDEFDCSGLTSWAYARAGITIPRTSRQQFTAGRAVSLDALQPGDLLFYDDGTGNPATIHHVAMYVGDGRMVDAPTEGQVVDVRDIEGDGHLMGARRIAG